jgi:hypothetical protein
MKMKRHKLLNSLSAKGLGKLLLASIICISLFAYAQEPGAESPPGQASEEAPGGAVGGAGDAGGTLSVESREYHLKAAFLRYVAKFVDWPSDAIPVDKINICVLGQVPNFKAINSINGKVVNDRAINITKVLQANDAKGTCQILFVTKTEEENVSNIVSTLNGLPILSFGDMENFAAKGGNMNFYIANNRLAIMINPPSVDKAKLKINPRMLKVVTVVPNVDNAAKKSVTN